ncbi:hypothetical protein [Sulfurimonas sp.]|uniref:hypothetical protein n=1 Tax=Sulfurimonas sp. TaxID=2022749 RepID=UPI003D0CA834
MQTIHLEVKDSYVANIMTLLHSLKDGMIDKIEIQSDPNLKEDPYFYERREDLHKLRDDVRSGKMQMYDFNQSMDELILELQK